MKIWAEEFKVNAFELGYQAGFQKEAISPALFSKAVASRIAKLINAPGSKRALKHLDKITNDIIRKREVLSKVNKMTGRFPGAEGWQRSAWNPDLAKLDKIWTKVLGI